jgi:hypothetical protein
MSVEQSISDPPTIVGTDRSGQRAVILALDPDFTQRFTLGHIEQASWQDHEGRTWSGRLHLPVGFDPRRRYPLVIQTNGHILPDDFSVTGNNTFAGTAYAAQALANRGIAVLQVNEDIPSKGVFIQPGEPAAAMAAYESAVDWLVGRGIIDPARIGIVGFSRSGWYVEYTIVFSRLHWTAAIVSDNMEPNYGQYLFNGYMRSELNLDIGAAPFGEGLLTWLQRSPGFNLERVRTPLRLETAQGGVIGAISQWQTFTMLRELHRPVELAVLPRSEEAIHPLQMPTQRYASQQATVDWFDFWLNGRERQSSETRDQYERWRRLRDDWAHQQAWETSGYPPGSAPNGASQHTE